MAGVDGKRFPAACLGAEFHSALGISQAGMILRKGYHPQIDSYSAFLENDQDHDPGRRRRGKASLA
jgi:hypothetical protein